MYQDRMLSIFDIPDPPVVDCSNDPIITRESEKDACDINKIVARFDVTGMLPQVPLEGLYLDVSDVGDYREAVERVRVAERFFAQLPAAVRTQFDNDPAGFLDFSSDPANRGQLEEWGLVEKAQVPPVEPPAPPAPAGPNP